MIQDRNRPEVSLEPPPVRWWKRLLRILAAVAIVLIGIAGATYLQKSASKPQRRPPVKWVPVVETQPLQSMTHRVVVTAWVRLSRHARSCLSRVCPAKSWP
jgi:hypothetical protein